MSDSPTTRYIRQEAPKVLDVIMKIAFPILLGAAAWSFNTLWDHGNRITKIEATRFTRADARESHANMSAKIVALGDNLGGIKESLAERRGADKDTARRLDRIEQSIQKILERLSK